MRMYYDVIFWNDIDNVDEIKIVYAQLQKLSEQTKLGVMSFRARPEAPPPEQNESE